MYIYILCVCVYVCRNMFFSSIVQYVAKGVPGVWSPFQYIVVINSALSVIQNTLSAVSHSFEVSVNFCQSSKNILFLG
jgi:hypothetical protein